MFVSIRIKFLLLFVALILIPLGVLRFITYLDISQAIRSEAFNNIDNLATIQKIRVEDLINTNKEEIEIASHSTVIANSLATYEASKETQDYSLLVNGIRTLSLRFPAFKQISVLDTNGIVIVSTDEQLIGKDYHTDASYKRGVLGINTATLVKISSKDIRFTLSNKIVQDGNVLGVMMVQKDAAPLYALFATISDLGRTGEWGLATHTDTGDGLVIVPGKSNSNSDAALTTLLPKKSSSPISLALNGEERVFPDLTDNHGTKVIAATRYIKDNDWGIDVTITQSEAYAILYQYVFDSLRTVLLLFLFVLVMVFVTYFVITNPINQLSRIVERIANGDFSKRAWVKTHDEIATLGEKINEMAKKLGEAKEKEEALDQAKDQFLSIAAHQMRTPLGIMRWNYEQLLQEETSLGNESKEILSKMNENTIKLISLVNTLLDISRINQGKLKVIKEAVDVNKEIQLVVANLQVFLTSEQILTFDLAKNMPLIVLDKKLFLQVIENLLSNAIKYTPKGKINISTKVDGANMTICLSDEGIGIPKKDQIRIFEKFFRAKNVDTIKSEGTGLGLFIVKTYVEAMGGTISFESEINKGTTFYLHFPIKD